MELEQLRDQLSAIDRQILELVAERQRLSGKIGAWKRASGRPTRDFAREKQVLDKARLSAAGLGVPTGLAEALFSLLIQSSLANQEQARVAPRARAPESPHWSSAAAARWDAGSASFCIPRALMSRSQIRLARLPASGMWPTGGIPPTSLRSPWCRRRSIAWRKFCRAGRP